MNSLVIEEARGVDALEALRDEWQALFAETNAPPFLSWAWMTAWHAAFGQHLTPRIFCAREAGRLVGLLALGEGEQRMLGLRLRRLAFLGEGEGGADYLDVLTLPGREREVAEAICCHLSCKSSFDVIELHAMAADSPSLPIFAQRFNQAGCSRRFLPGEVCPQIELADTWDEVLKASHRATNFKRRLSYLRKLDGFERRVMTAPEEARAAFDRFLFLHEQRWAAQGGSDAMGRQVVRNFHRDAVERLAREGLLRFEELWIEGECRASLYSMECGGRFYYYQTGCDQEWTKRSVGLVLLGLSIEDAVQRGLKVYDLLRGSETYKFDWATGTRRLVTLQVTGCSLAAVLFTAHSKLRAAAREAVRELLPESTIELLRRWRRWRERRQDVEALTESPATLTAARPDGLSTGIQ